MPKTGVETTGEPLKVEARTETQTYVTREKVGELQHRDSAGRIVGTSSVYEDRLGIQDVTRWQVFQGDSPIDDQDFYSIAGDTATAREIAEYRANGVLMNRIGLGLMIGGGAIAIASMILGASLQSKDQLGVPTRPAWPFYITTAGGITASVGGTLTWAGLARTKRQHPIDDPQRAAHAAKRYNKAIGEVPEEGPRPRRP